MEHEGPPGRTRHTLDLAGRRYVSCEKKKVVFSKFTGRMALFGGGSHSWVNPISDNTGISSVRCAHQLRRSCLLSHVKVCSYAIIRVGQFDVLHRPGKSTMRGLCEPGGPSRIPLKAGGPKL